jgi:TonB family protein
MNAFLEYLLKSGVALTVFYFFYWIFLRNDTHFRLNRVIMVGSLVLSLTLPLAQIQINRVEPVIPVFSINFETDDAVASGMTGVATSSEWNLWKVIVWIYAAGAVLVLLRLVYQGIYMQALSRLSKSEKHSDFTLVYMEKDIIPFSYFNKIFIPASHTTLNGIRTIIDHERSHLKQWHFLDLFLAEFITIIQWFNPVAWLYERSVKEIHEYLADRAILDQGYNQGSYQALLVNQAMGGPVFTVANQFNQSLIKKRIVMMTKMKSPRWAMLKAFFLLPLVAILLMAYSQPEETLQDLKTLYSENVIIPNETPSQASGSVQKVSQPSANKPVSSQKAEQIKITGKVVDESGNDMPGVAIVIKGTTSGTITDNAGDFVILVPDKDAILVFSSVGYKSKTINVKNEDRLYVKMEENILKISLTGANSFVAAEKSTNEKNTTGNSFVVIEETPTYPGGTDALKKFLDENLKPVNVKDKITGTVTVNFVIDKEGNIVNPKVWRGVHPTLDEEALRVIRLIKGWKPGMQNGKPVACKVSIPVKFK